MELLKKRNWLQLMAEGAEGAAEGDNGQNATGEAAAEPIDLEAEFDGLTKKDGKYRDVYGKRVQKAVAERTKSMRAAVDRMNSFGNAIDILAAKYGTTSDDPNLPKLIEGDKSLLEDRALRNGNSPETEAALVKAQAQQKKTEAALMQVLAEQEARNWDNQAKELEQKYPGANVREALANPQFKSLMGAPYNLDFKTAYMAMFGENLIEQAAAKERKKVTDTVAAGAKRPRENGMGSQAGAAAKVNWSTMSSAEFKEYERRVSRGERIPF